MSRTGTIRKEGSSEREEWKKTCTLLFTTPESYSELLYTIDQPPQPVTSPWSVYLTVVQIQVGGHFKGS